MRLVEFLTPIKSHKRETLALSVLYWFEQYGSQPSMTAAQVKAALGQARLAGTSKVNVQDVLAKAGAKVDVVGNNESGAKLWGLTETGRRVVREVHGLPDHQPEIQHSVNDLNKVVAKVSTRDAKEFLEEAILCVGVGALRAAIVFVWVAAIAEVKTRAWAAGARAVNASIQSRNQNAKPLSRHDDLLKVQEIEILQVAQDVGVLDKSQHLILKQALDTRNQCGHPNKYRPGVAKVRSVIEDVTGVLWI